MTGARVRHKKMKNGCLSVASFTREKAARQTPDVNESRVQSAGGK
jgi:hypothetical protein